MKHLDKLKHFGVGFIVAFGLSAVLPITGMYAPISALVGYAKERYDSKKAGSTSEGWDAYATAVGGIVADMLWTLYYLYIMLVIMGMRF